jgi:hypothetical protein
MILRDLAIRQFFPHHSFVEDKKISGDKQSGSDMLGPKIGDRDYISDTFIILIVYWRFTGI